MIMREKKREKKYRLMISCCSSTVGGGGVGGVVGGVVAIARIEASTKISSGSVGTGVVKMSSIIV